MYIGAGRDVQSRLGVTVLVGNGACGPKFMSEQYFFGA